MLRLINIFLQFIQRNFSSFFVAAIFCSLTASVVEYGIIKRKKAFDFLGPRPNEIVDQIMKIAPYGYVEIFTNNATKSSDAPDYFKFDRYDMFFSDPKNTSLKKDLARFYRRYRRAIKEKNNALVLTLYRGGTHQAHISLIGDSPCITSIIANAIIPNSTLFLTTGEYKKEEDFLGHDVLQQATYPSIHSPKYHQSFLANKLIIASELLLLCLTCAFKQVAKNRQ